MGIAEGEVEVEDKVLIIKRIHVTYHLKLDDPDTQKDAVDRVVASHVKFCPVARSLMPSIDITTSVEITQA